MKKTFTAALAATFITAVLPAHARGWSWFVHHIGPGDKCSGAHPTTYYGDGRHNADGTRFNPSGYSVATWDYPFGTVLRVTNSRNGESVNVVVKDRGPARFIYNMGIHLDLSTGAARAIHLGQNGRFESGYTCHEVVSMGVGAVIARTERHHSRRHGHAEKLAYTPVSYMDRFGAGQ